MRKFTILMVFMAIASWVNLAQAAPPSSSDQKCVGPFTLVCASPPCFPIGSEGVNFSGTNNEYNLTLHVISGSPSIEIEGKTVNAGSFFPMSTFTAGFDGYLLRRPPVLRVVVNTGATAGTGVICGNN